MYIRMTVEVQIPQPDAIDKAGRHRPRKPIVLPAGETVSVAESLGNVLAGRGQALLLPPNYDPRQDEDLIGRVAEAAIAKTVTEAAPTKKK